jgi:hypothetical protein
MPGLEAALFTTMEKFLIRLALVTSLLLNKKNHFTLQLLVEMEFSLPISFIQRKCKISSIADQEFFSHIQIHNIKNNGIMLMQIQILLFTLQRIQL